LLDPGHIKEGLSLGPSGLHLGLKPLVVADPDHLVDLFQLTQLVNLEHGEPPVGPKHDHRPRTSSLKLADHPLENSRCSSVASWALPGRNTPHGEPTEQVEHQKEMAHILAEVPMEQAQLLVSMGGIIGRVQIDQDDTPGIGMYQKCDSASFSLTQAAPPCADSY